MKSLFYRNEAIEIIASDVLEILENNNIKKNTSEKTSTFLRKIVKHLNGTVETLKSPPQLEEENGCLEIYKDGSFTIFLPPTTSHLRDNFTIAHELGHYFLHYILKKDRFDNDTIVFTRYGSDIKEVQANRFAAAFLMPKDKFKKIQKKYKGSVPLIAGYFGVSASAVAARMDSLSDEQS